MEGSWCRTASLLCKFALSLTSLSAAAQVVASKDVSTPPVATALAEKSYQTPPAAPTSPTSNNNAIDDCVIGFKDGVVVSTVPEKLRLELVSVEPRAARLGTTLAVTVRVTNDGADAVRVPWGTQPVEPDIDPKTKNTSLEVANIHLSFATREDPRNSTFLKGEEVLVAAPSSRAQHLELLPGQSADVKFKAVLECESSVSWKCQGLPTGGHTELTAHWWEWTSTHEVDGCNTWRGSYDSRKLESQPLPLVYTSAPPATERKSATRPD